jgi:hypothetical protein
MFFFLLLSGVVYGADKMTITFHPASDGGGDIYEIDTASIAKLPSWNPDVQEPPLSISSALKIARKELSGQKDGEDLQFLRVEVSFSGRDDAPVWYYAFSFVKFIKNGVIEKNIYVLMNGELLKSRKISKEEYGKWHLH